MEEKSWLEVEMQESMDLLRKRLEKLNNLPVEDLDEEIVCEIKNIYKAIYYIKSITATLHR